MSRESWPQWDVVEQLDESLRIENIHTGPAPEEIEAHLEFMAQEELSVAGFTKYVDTLQPGARLRTNGENVRIGDYFPPVGGQAILYKLQDICDKANMIPRLLRPEQAWEFHVEYEKLHPFTDGNGRSGRALWYWMMQSNPRWASNYGFLRSFYYQTLHRQSV